MCNILCDQLDDATSLSDLPLGLLGDISGADDDGDVGETALSENLAVSEGEQVENGGLVALLGEVLVALLGGNQGPELVEVHNGLPELVLELVEVPHTDLSCVDVRCDLCFEGAGDDGPKYPGWYLSMLVR